MKKRVSKNSRHAFAANDFEPREWQVYRAIQRRGKVTRQQLVEITGLKINCITGRVTRLLDRGFIEECGSERNSDTGMPNGLLRVKQRKAAA